MNGAVVRRWLKVADPTAVTARETLQRALGRGREVEEVQRSEVIALGWAGSPPGAREAVTELARSTNLLLNPNKHFHVIAAGEESIRPRGNVWVLVSEPEEGSGLGATIARRRLLPFPLDRVHAATLWELTLEGDEATREERARDLAVSRSRTSGLLGNPHYQDIAVFGSAPTAAGLLDHLLTQETPA
jgi:hypothetical protein